MATKLNMTLLLRRADFTAEAKKGYVLLAGEPGYCTATKTFKVGDGATTWENLDFANQEHIEALIAAGVAEAKAYADGKFKTKQDAYSVAGDAKKTVTGVTQNTNGEIEVTFGDIDFDHNHDEQYKKIQAAIAAASTDKNVFVETVAQDAQGVITIGTKAVDFSDYRTAEDQDAIDATFETIAEADKVRVRVQNIENELDDYGDIVTHNAVEFEAAGAAAAAEDRINAALKDYYTKTEADLEFATPAEVIEEVNNALKNVSDADSITNITTLVNYVNTNGANLDGLISEVYGAAEMTGKSRLDTAEEKLAKLEAADAAGITADDINNWNNEIGAKALAQGVVDVVDANKATWDKAGTAVQTTTYEAYIAGKSMSDEELKSYTDTKIAGFNTETVAPIAARVKAIEDAPYTTKKYVDDQDAITLQAAKAYADTLDHEDTTYTFAPTPNALEFTATPTGKGSAQTIKLVAPVVDVGVTKVIADTDIVVTPDAGTGEVTVAHAAYSTGTVAKDPANADDPHFINGITIKNGHVTGATVQSLADALQSMELILDGGFAE